MELMIKNKEQVTHPKIYANLYDGCSPFRNQRFRVGVTGGSSLQTCDSPLCGRAVQKFCKAFIESPGLKAP